MPGFSFPLGHVQIASKFYYSRSNFVILLGLDRCAWNKDEFSGEFFSLMVALDHALFFQRNRFPIMKLSTSFVR